MKIPRWLDHTLLALGLTCSVLSVAFILFALPQFEAVFREFGVEVPAATRFLLRFRLGLLLLPTLVLVIGLWGPGRTCRGLVAMLVGVAGSGLGLSVLYLPIFKLGAIV